MSTASPPRPAPALALAVAACSAPITPASGLAALTHTNLVTQQVPVSDGHLRAAATAAAAAAAAAATAANATDAAAAAAVLGAATGTISVASEVSDQVDSQRLDVRVQASTDRVPQSVQLPLDFEGDQRKGRLEAAMPALPLAGRLGGLVFELRGHVAKRGGHPVEKGRWDIGVAPRHVGGGGEQDGAVGPGGQVEQQRCGEVGGGIGARGVAGALGRAGKHDGAVGRGGGGEQ